MTWNRLAPWHPTTNALITYPRLGIDNIWWRPADKPFFAVLNFTGFTRGRSAARAEFQINTRGGTVEMFLRDLSDMLKAGHFIKPSMDGHWVVVKRGENYGVRLASLDAKEKKS